MQTHDLSTVLEDEHAFDHKRAFSRTVGWVTSSELEKLRKSTVSIAGLGGVGGSHLLALARLGVENFRLAEFDKFELHNMNRQAGCSMSTLGKSKLDVMVAMAKDINPNISVRLFPDGLRDANVCEFLRGTDIYVDGLDYFALPARLRAFEVAHALGVPAVTAAPLGMGVSFLHFSPQGMSLEKYLNLQPEDSERDKYAKFTAGISPSMLMLGYLKDPSAVNFDEKRGPSTGLACLLCSGVLGTMVLKILLGRGSVPEVPRVVQFDAYKNRMTVAWRPWGNRNPLQRLVLAFVRRAILKDVWAVPAFFLKTTTTACLLLFLLVKARQSRNSKFCKNAKVFLGQSAKELMRRQKI
jgi:molybdopterin/thiamine biosynthesis adenylyltransferase